MIFTYAGVVRCKPVGHSNARDDVKMSLNAYSKFLEQDFV